MAKGSSSPFMPLFQFAYIYYDDTKRCEVRGMIMIQTLENASISLSKLSVPEHSHTADPHAVS